MELEEAIKILKHHNTWRRFDGEPEDSPEMPNPKQLGIAIDLIIKHYNNKSREYIVPDRDTNTIIEKV